jgi:hypothetical protein
MGAMRDPGKFPCAGCGRPSREAESAPVTKTWGCPGEQNLSRRGEDGR